MQTPHSESVLSRTVRIIEAFSPDDPALTVSEIARRADLHVATASRLDVVGRPETDRQAF